MTGYVAPIGDMRFLCDTVLDIPDQLAALPAHADFSADLLAAILEQAARFSSEVIAPLNRIGDEEGCRLEEGEVRTPTGFSAAWQQFTAAGWTGLSGNPVFGGQGMPRVVQVMLDEMLASANLSFGLFAGLTRGAIEAIEAHATPELCATWLPRMVSGEFTGAMALTEAHSGTDLGLLRCKAVPNGDGSYQVSGTKIFISSGDQDFGGNIVHLVLARLPDAPEGVKGISMFLCPKFLLDADGNPAACNGISVGALEKKMGIHGQPTCVMHYENATGWLIGEAGRGLNAMFTMMNAERLFVGIQGLGIAEVASQHASRYAHERLQGRTATVKGPVAIVEHADIRRMLMTGQALTEGGRALAMWTALQMDLADSIADGPVRQQAADLVALLTPLVKAALTDFGFEVAVQSQQVFGGHGYIRETGAEQFVRDARITQIYEGTNGVQAMDLVTRKLPMAGGQVLRDLLAIIRAELASANRVPQTAEIRAELDRALADFAALSAEVLAMGSDIQQLGAIANDYLHNFAMIMLGWFWLRMAEAALRDAQSHQGQRKLLLARHFACHVLPRTLMHAAAIRIGAKVIATADPALI